MTNLKQFCLFLLLIFFIPIILKANYFVILNDEKIIEADDVDINSKNATIYFSNGYIQIPLFKIKSIESDDPIKTNELNRTFWFYKTGILLDNLIINSSSPYSPNKLNCINLLLKIDLTQYYKECNGIDLFQNNILVNIPLMLSDKNSLAYLSSKNDENSIEKLHKIALINFLLSNYDDACFLWSMASQNSSEPSYKYLMIQAKWLKQNKNLMNKEMIQDVILIYPNKLNKLINAKVKQSIKQFQSKLSYLFAFKPYNPITIVIYPKEIFYKITGMPNWVKGYTKDFICIVEQDDFSSTIKHELTHAYINQLTFERAPTWFQEGAAQYLSTGKINKKSEEKYLNKIDNNINGMAYSDDLDKKKIYQQSMKEVEEIFNRNNLIAIRKYLSLLRIGEDEKEAFEESFSNKKNFYKNSN